MLDFALLIITLTAGGEQRLSITEVASEQGCQQTRATVVGLLKQRQTQVLTARCAANTLALTPYAHGAKSADYQHHYQVRLQEDEGFQLTYLAPGETCKEKGFFRKSVLCAIASQSPIAPPAQ